MNLCKQCQKPIPPTRTSVVVKTVEEKDSLLVQHRDKHPRAIVWFSSTDTRGAWRVSWEDGRAGGFMNRGDFHALNCAALFGQSAMEEIRAGSLVASAKRKRRG